MLSVLGSLGMMFWLAMTPHNPETEKKRLGMLAVFAFLTGDVTDVLGTLLVKFLLCMRTEPCL